VVLSKRERLIVIVTGAAVGIFGFDRFLISPLMARQAALSSEIDTATVALEKDRALVNKKPALDRKWTQLISGGLKRDQSEAQSQVLNSLNEWANEAGLDAVTIGGGSSAQVPSKPGKPNEKEKAFLRMTCRASGKGGMAQIGRFIWRIQTAAIPLRITDLAISTNREATDDLQVNIGLSTIFLSPDALKPGVLSMGSPATSREVQPR
jgi:hypothetical protein